ncbi:unnamed protein product, partial [Owenia fusiformis]
PAFLFDLISLHIKIPPVSLDWSKYYHYSLVLIDFFYTCSSFTFVIAMLVRYVGLCHRRNFQFLLTKRTIKAILFICYTLAFSLNFPEIFMSFKVVTVTSGNLSYHTVAVIDSGVHSLWIARILIAGTIPFIINTYCIIRLIIVLQQNKGRIKALFSNDLNSITRANRLAEQDSATKSLLINVFAYMILVIPNDVYGIYAFATGDDNNTIRSILWVFLLGNFCANFLINVTVHKKFRKSLKIICGIQLNAIHPQSSSNEERPIPSGSTKLRSTNPISVLKVDTSANAEILEVNVCDSDYCQPNVSMSAPNTRCTSSPIINVSLSA